MFGVAYAMLGVACALVPLFVTFKEPVSKNARIVAVTAGMFMLITATGAFLRKRWTAWFAVFVHSAMLVAGVAFTFVQSRSIEDLAELRQHFVARGSVILIYTAFVAFWLRRDVRECLSA